MTAIILCGGEGMRFRNEHFSLPKVMVEINGRPLLWHIMKLFASYGVKKFIVCVRDDDREISDYFEQNLEWDIQLLRTGNQTPTGGRIKLAEPHVTGDVFFVTYGDGLSDVDLSALLTFHEYHQRMATLTAVRAHSQYGVLQTDPSGKVTKFEEKPLLKDWINGGYFVLSRRVFEYLSEEETLEECLAKVLVPMGELTAFRHEGFWKSIDTYKDYIEIQQIYSSKLPF